MFMFLFRMLVFKMIELKNWLSCYMKCFSYEVLKKIINFSIRALETDLKISPWYISLNMSQKDVLFSFSWKFDHYLGLLKIN